MATDEQNSEHENLCVEECADHAIRRAQVYALLAAVRLYPRTLERGASLLRRLSSSGCFRAVVSKRVALFPLSQIQMPICTALARPVRSVMIPEYGVAP